MRNLSYYEEDRLLNNSLRDGTYYLALFLNEGNEGVAGSEVSGSGYTRHEIAFSAPRQQSTTIMGETVTASQCANSAAVNFGEAGGSWGTVSHWGIFDASAGGNLLWKGAFSTSKQITEGDNVVVKDGDVKISLY